MPTLSSPLHTLARQARESYGSQTKPAPPLPGHSTELASHTLAWTSVESQLAQPHLQSLGTPCKGWVPDTSMETCAYLSRISEICQWKLTSTSFATA